MKSNLTKWDPFQELDNLRGLTRLLNPRNLVSGEDQGDSPLVAGNWAPAVDIVEDDKEYVIKADLPEVNKKEVHVTFENGMLTISGERKFENEENDDKKKYHRVERSYGSYTRSFRLPETVDAEKVDAKFKDGVLSVHLPKKEDVKPKHIEVKVS